MQATTAPGSSSGAFVDKTDLTPGTKWTATDANAWQAELLEVITEAGLVPDGGDLTQVRQAIQLLAKLVKVDAASEADYADYADAADTLATPRTIGGVSFDGSANINLPGVNKLGNQNTSGNASTATTASYLNFEEYGGPDSGLAGKFEINSAKTYLYIRIGVNEWRKIPLEAI